MTPRRRRALRCLCLLGLWAPIVCAAAGPHHWPQWRGPLATGVAPDAAPPLRWSETANVRWKVEIPGRGHASPVIWDDRVFVLTAVAAKRPGTARASMPEEPLDFLVLAIDRRNGSTVWQRTACTQTPHEGTHPDGSWASASAATDGEVVLALFGSRGLYAYDFDGRPLWQIDFGDMQTRRGFGEGSSPVLYGEVVVVNWDHEGQSFIIALDKRTGREIWRQARDEVTSWSTPIVVEVDGRPQVVVSATGRMRGYDLSTGRIVWEMAGMTVNVIPSPVFGNGLLYAASGFRGNALRAIRLAGARGNLDSSEALVWSYDRDTPYVPSPLLYGDFIYFLKSNSGVLTALAAGTGELLHGPTRLPEITGVYASPVGAAGRVYVVGRGGRTVVLRHGEKFEVLAINTLEDGFDASPAIAADEIFLRGRRYLYCIADEEQTAGKR